MQKTSKGRLCTKCSNTIYDFRNKSNAEIALIHATTEGSVCGLYSKNQLKTTDNLSNTANKRHFVNFSFYGLLALFLNKEAEAKPLIEIPKIETLYKIDLNSSENSIKGTQTQAKQDSSFISGQVKVKEEMDVVSQLGINILIEGTDVGTTSDINGNFILHIPSELSDKDSIVVVFKFIGYATRKVTVYKETQGLEVVLTLDDTQVSEFYVYAKPPWYKRIWFWLTHPFSD